MTRHHSMLQIVDNRWIAALLLGLVTAVLLTATAPDIGLTWDEPAYIAASESYVEWFQQLLSRPDFALSAKGIQTYWQPNHEHPPLDKVWSGIVWSTTRGLLGDLTAHRLGNILLVGALVAMVYGLAAGESSGSSGTPLVARAGLAGLAAVAALISMPRFFFHAHLAALDMPAAVTVFGVTFLFWRLRNRPEIGWDVVLGLVWGLAMATKINALFVPAVLLLWVLIRQRHMYLFRRLVLMGLVGLPLSFALWPWLYYEFLPRLAEYVLFVTVEHWKIGQWYLGRFHMPPPWHFPFVMVLVTVPLGLTVLYLLGIARTAVDRRARDLGSLLILSALVPLLAPVLGNSVMYDNERLFMPAFPFLAVLAGLGFEWIVQGLHKLFRSPALAFWPKALAAVLAAVIWLPHLAAAGSLYPHLLSYYSEAVGGLPGAVRLGLETTYWCETYAAALSYLNAHAQPGDTVWVEDWSHDVMLYYQLHGRLARSLLISWPPTGTTAFVQEWIKGYPISIEEADYVVIQYRQTGFSAEIQQFLRSSEPVYQLTHRGIPLMQIYQRTSAHAP